MPCPECGTNLMSPASRMCAPCRRQKRGENHGSWKGGVIKLKSGYVREYAPDHPRANLGRYVLQHHLVMEEILGRYLLPGENVHHKNGVRDDNRPENLELWIKSQPTGTRVEDAVAWAREILERYEGIST